MCSEDTPHSIFINIGLEHLVDLLRDPGAIDNQELLFHEQAIGDDSPCTAGSREFGDRSQ